MSITLSILSTLGGVVTGIAQDILHEKKENREKKLELEIWKEKQNINVLNQQKLKTLDIENNKLNAQVKETELTKEQEKTEQSWYNNIQQSTKYIDNINNSKLINFANFIISTTRPIVTYLFLAFLVVIFLTQIKNNATQDWIENFTQSILFLTEAIIGFWFYRRGSEKRDIKKKL